MNWIQRASTSRREKELSEEQKRIRVVTLEREEGREEKCKEKEMSNLEVRSKPYR